MEKTNCAKITIPKWILQKGIKSYFCPPFVREVAQPGSALAWGARGRWFESSLPDTIFKKAITQMIAFFLFSPIFFARKSI